MFFYVFSQVLKCTGKVFDGLGRISAIYLNRLRFRPKNRNRGIKTGYSTDLSFPISFTSSVQLTSQVEWSFDLHLISDKGPVEAVAKAILDLETPPESL